MRRSGTAGGRGALISALVLGLATLAPAPVPGASAKWSAAMRGMQQSLKALLVDLSSDERFNDPKRAAAIGSNVDRIAQAAHGLPKLLPQAGDADPTLAILAQEFSNEALQARAALKAGQRAYARGTLRALTGYCLACHTRSASADAASSARAPLEAELRGLGSLERAQYLASTRQFDAALDELERLVADVGAAERQGLDWEEAVRLGLAISVRVKRDPARALRLAERVLATPHAPYFFKEQATQWKKSLQAWQAEGTPKAQTEEGYFTEAVKRLADARAAQKYPSDRSADVLYLRASAAVHDLLAHAPQGRHAAEALYMAGLCYEVLRDLNLWDQHELYYLACLLKAPHTDQGRECFKHYEQSVTYGYTGSGGTHLPTEVQKRLKELRRLADPLGPS